MPKIALAQMNSSDNLVANLHKMHALLKEAAGKGAKGVAFPEMAYFSANVATSQPLIGEYQRLVNLFSDWAKEFSVWLIPGTLREPCQEPGKYFNSLPVLSPQGKLAGKYRKIFLFEASLPDRKYQESMHCVAGNSIQVMETELGNFGLSICFDLRFPELFRSLKKRGAQMVFLPSAFTVPTGEKHWLPLLQARAIENQIFMVAPALVGENGNAAVTYGHSVVVSPWGEVLGRLGKEEAVLVCDIDITEIESATSRVASWESRRENIFPIA